MRVRDDLKTIVDWQFDVVINTLFVLSAALPPFLAIVMSRQEAEDRDLSEVKVTIAEKLDDQFES